MKTYLVGGAVRDQLLNFPYHEKDWVVVGSTPEEMLAQGFTPVGKDFPVFLHPTTHEEYALARTERKTAPGYKGFTFHTDKNISLEEDLQRRDLTINAIAKADDGTLTDPYGGQQDIKNKVLRHVSSAFREDPVRVLRVARFAARYHHLGFCIADDTLQMMRDIVEQGETQALVAERVWQEIHKALSERHPEQFFYTLHRCGALGDLVSDQKAIQQKIADLSLAPLLNTMAYYSSESLSSRKPQQHPMIRFAAFCFIFEPNEINAVCQHVSAPNDYTDLAILLKQHHDLCTSNNHWSTETLSRLFQQCDTIRRPDRFRLLLTANDAITFSNSASNVLTAELLRALHAYQTVDHQSLIQQGFTKAALGQAIQHQRKKQLAEWLEKFKP
ncbi:MAG: tRNA nucleotidyltransferase (CCA-adding enzyme) [Candidatus Endobugula sp.]|jgi:tRNA nucleotidyltransferase (CCA-adding enzyme)